MTEILKHEKFRYCGRKDCRWFSKCGLAATAAIIQEAERKGLELKLRKPCSNYYVTFDVPKKGKKR